MAEQVINPEKITKPIQLLGAWLAGLFSIDTCFLFFASSFPPASLEARILIIAAIANVPAFLWAVFLLQTKFRPELQEDSYYATYLSQKTNEPISIPRDSTHIGQLIQKISELEAKITHQDKASTSTPANLASLSIGVNKHLANQDAIGKRLSEVGVISFTKFGTNKPPLGRNVAIAGYLPRSAVKDIVMVAKELGFNSYTMFDNQAEGTDEDVLFGAYGEPQFEIAGATA